MPGLDLQNSTAHVKTTLVILATVAHFTPAGITALVIFRNTGTHHDRTQRTMSIIVYSLFIATIFILNLLLASNIFLDSPPPTSTCTCG